MYNFGQASNKTTILNNFWLRLAYKWRGGTIREAAKKKMAISILGGVYPRNCNAANTATWVYPIPSFFFFFCICPESSRNAKKNFLGGYPPPSQVAWDLEYFQNWASE